MSRIPLVVGNSKMYKTIPETVDFCRSLKEELFPGLEGPALRTRKVEVAVVPPFTALSAAAQALGDRSSGFLPRTPFGPKAAPTPGKSLRRCSRMLAAVSPLSAIRNGVSFFTKPTHPSIKRRPPWLPGV